MSLRELKELELVNIVDNRLRDRPDRLGKQLSSSPLTLAESSEESTRVLLVWRRCRQERAMGYLWKDCKLNS